MEHNMSDTHITERQDFLKFEGLYIVYADMGVTCIGKSFVVCSYCLF